MVRRHSSSGHCTPRDIQRDFFISDANLLHIRIMEEEPQGATHRQCDYAWMSYRLWDNKTSETLATRIVEVSSYLSAHPTCQKQQCSCIHRKIGRRSRFPKEKANSLQTVRAANPGVDRVSTVEIVIHRVRGPPGPEKLNASLYWPHRAAFLAPA